MCLILPSPWWGRSLLTMCSEDVWWRSCEWETEIDWWSYCIICIQLSIHMNSYKQRIAELFPHPLFVTASQSLCQSHIPSSMKFSQQREHWGQCSQIHLHTETTVHLVVHTVYPSGIWYYPSVYPLYNGAYGVGLAAVTVSLLNSLNRLFQQQKKEYLALEDWGHWQWRVTAGLYS